MKRIINHVRLHASGQVARTTKAAAVKEAAGELLTLWEKEVSKYRGANFYMHIAYHHLPEFIARLPVDILQASGDSFEAKNQELKRRLRRYAIYSLYCKVISNFQEYKQEESSKQNCWFEKKHNISDLPSTEM